jgi:hypothetical protein
VTVTGSVVIATVLNDIMYAMAYLIALMAGMNSTVVSDINSQACEPSIHRSPWPVGMHALPWI